MAIPFTVPEDHQEVEVIINQLQELLTRLQAAVRRSRGTTQPTNQTSTTRVRPVGTIRSNRASRDEQVPSTSSSSPTISNVPNLLSNLAWLAAVSQEVVASSNSIQMRTNGSNVRSPRRRTSSESSNCEEPKDGNHGNRGKDQDQNQTSDGDDESTSGNNGLLSKIVEGPVSAPLWTAMICFVGWHLFRVR